MSVTPAVSDPQAVAEAFARARSPQNLRRAAVAGGVGTALEQFDFAAYGLAAALVFPAVFFPGDDPLAGALKSFAAYAVGFCARPLGGFIFAHFGEKHGRRWVLFGTLALMGAATFLIGVIPSHAQIGVAAPIMLFILRILQGAGAGAEQAGSATLLTETAKKGRRGRLSSSVMIGAAGGTVLGTAVFAIIQALTNDAQFESWGWRIVFWLSILVTVGAFLIRRHLAESPIFAELKQSAGEAEREKAPLAQALRYGWKPILRCFFMNWGPNTNSYTVQTFFVTFVTTSVVIGTKPGGGDLFFPKGTITDIQLVGAIIAMGSAFCWGFLSDKIGRKPVTVALAGAGIVLPFVYFSLLNTGVTVLVGLAVILGFIFAAYGTVGAQMSYFPELFGSRCRYAGVTIAREVSAVVGGGVAPFICAALLEHYHTWVPLAIYTGFTMLCALAASLMAPETLDRDLTISTDAVPGEAHTATD